ncbi:helix-turn-helix transcriptional regulator [Brevibacterium yomogidense]|uniref:helix-turn-helix transcriptional regulator n=1 Tax=Brevibacterium yomogidense TaxID=946573 RepID=UPI0018DF1457|nr:LuxR family transcriptional regulator [Brevibacterium yomogidense]
MYTGVRRHELARLQSMIEQRLNVAVTGGPGMGKSTVVNALARRIDAQVIRVPCSRADSHVPRSGVWGAIAALRVLGDGEFIRALEEIAASGESAAQSADAAVEVVRSTPVPRRVLVIFDGFDLLDTESQELFGHMLRRMTYSHLTALVTARRVRDDGPLTGVPTIELGPLDRVTTIALAHDMVQESISDDAAATAAVASGGNPLVLRHILSSMTARQRRGEAPFPRPVRTSEAAARTALEDLPDVSEDTLEMLRIVALSPLTPVVTVQRRYAHVWEEVLELMSRGTIDQEGPYLCMDDILLRCALHWGMTASQRSALRVTLVSDAARHRTARGATAAASEAEASATAASEPTGPASPASAEATTTAEVPASSATAPTSAGTPGTEDRESTIDGAITRWHRSFTEFDEDAPMVLLRDARSLVVAGYPDAGVSFAERALMLAPDPARLARRLLSLAETLLLNGDVVFAERYVRFARTADDAALQLRALTITTQADFFHREAVPAGVRHLWGPHQVAEVPEAVARLQLTLVLCHAERFELSEAQELLTAAGDLLAAAKARGRTPIPGVEMLFECAKVMVDGYRGKGDRALVVYRTLLAPRRSLMAGFTAITAGRALTMTEHYTEAREIFELLERRLRDTSVWYPIVPLLRAELEIRVGNLHLVPGLLNQANRRRIPGQPMREDQRLLLECWTLYAQGKPSDAEAVEQDLVRRASATGNRGALALLSSLQGSHLLAIGLPAEAVRHLQRCDELAPGDIAPTVIRHEPELIEALLSVGRREHAALVLQRFRTRLTRFPSRWGELAAQRCEAMLATGEQSLDLFRRLLRGWRHTDSDHEKARTLAAYAQRLRDLGARSEAADPLLLARTLYERTGDRVREHSLTPTEVRDVPAKPSHPMLTQLSEEELRVVELVQEGLRNREIAERIFVSLRTVEIRLTGIYRRFGVRSRTELIAKISGAAEPVSG